MMAWLSCVSLMSCDGSVVDHIYIFVFVILMMVSDVVDDAY
jgi:hypothetical protein